MRAVTAPLYDGYDQRDVIGRYLAPLKALLMLFDALTAFALFLLVVSVRFDLIDPTATWDLGELRPAELALAYAVLWVGSLYVLGVYRLRTHWTLRGEINDVVRATALLIAVSLGTLYILKLTDVSRLFLAILWTTQPVVTVASRLLLRRAMRWLRARGHINRRMLVIGTGPDAEAFANEVERHRELGLLVIGHLRGPSDRDPTVSRPILGNLDDIEEVLHSNVIDEVALSLASTDWALVEPATRICEEEGKIVRVSVAPLGGMFAGGHYEELGRLPIMTFLYGPDRAIAMAFKRGFDIVVSALLLVVLSPLLLLIALYIRLTNGPPVVFRQVRVGLHGRVFTCLKYRTMVPDAEERLGDLAHLNELRGPAFKIASDPRITRSGRRLRRTSLDELPQLINVLRGEMSIVGPRPATPREVAQYDVWHRRRLSMRPGLTGLWQVQARGEYNFDQRANLDLHYIDRWTLWLDIKILLRTIPAMVLQQGS